MINSLSEVGRHGLESFGENLLDLLDNVSLSGSKWELVVEMSKGYLDSLVDW